jgi:hypothetical protein
MQQTLSRPTRPRIRMKEVPESAGPAPAPIMAPASVLFLLVDGVIVIDNVADGVIELELLYDMDALLLPV